MFLDNFQENTMRKILILLVIACLGLGSGVYVAHQTKSKNLVQMFAAKGKTTAPVSWTVNHPKWTGKFTKTGDNRIILSTNGDKATIVSNKDGLLTVKWDRWGTETFKCNDKNVCTLNK